MSASVDLTAITTPFGLLDRETQKALKEHGGPYEYWFSSSLAWREAFYNPGWCASNVYRVKPAPPKPREVWINLYPHGIGNYNFKSQQQADLSQGMGRLKCLRFREVIDN